MSSIALDFDFLLYGALIAAVATFVAGPVAWVLARSLGRWQRAMAAALAALAVAALAALVVAATDRRLGGVPGATLMFWAMLQPLPLLAFLFLHRRS